MKVIRKDSENKPLLVYVAAVARLAETRDYSPKEIAAKIADIKLAWGNGVDVEDCFQELFLEGESECQAILEESEKV